MRNYTAKDIRDLLNSLHLSEYLPLVDNYKITGDLLSACDTWENLVDLGISKSVHAKLLLRSIEELQSASGELEISIVFSYFI